MPMDTNAYVEAGWQCALRNAERLGHLKAILDLLEEDSYTRTEAVQRYHELVERWDAEDKEGTA